jgi:CDP-diacylglycerol--glycerol-3-phosphate 3-phosphatidyltransferase
MASIYNLKPAFQKLLRPLCGLLRKIGVTPNHVTVTTVILSCGMGLIIYMNARDTWPLFVLPAFLFVRMALNAIDGMLAREFNMMSRIGGVLNELGDVISDAVIYLPMVLISQFPVLPIVCFVVLAIISEMAGVVSVQVGGTRRYDGPMGKSDRAFVIGALSFCVAFNVISEQWLLVLLWIVSALVVVTIVNRCHQGLKEAAA